MGSSTRQPIGAQEPSVRTGPAGHVVGRPTANRRRQARRQFLVDAAVRVFHERGYASAPIQEVADAAGVKRATLYYYIDSKEQLLDEILRGVHTDALLESRERSSPDRQPWPSFAALSSRSSPSRPKTGSGSRFITTSFGPTERQAAIAGARSTIDDLLRSLIERGQAEGVVRRDLDQQRPRWPSSVPFMRNTYPVVLPIAEAWLSPPRHSATSLSRRSLTVNS